MQETFKYGAVAAALSALLAGCGGGGSGPTTNEVAPAAAVTVTETANLANANVGDRLGWTITAANRGGTATSAAVSLSATLPSGLGGIVVTPQGASCTWTLSSLACTIPAGMAPGAVATVAVMATATSAGTLSSTLSSTGADSTGCAPAASCSASITVAQPSGNAAAAANSVGFVPLNGEAAAYVDTRLQLTFDAPPVLGKTGTIRIYNATTGVLVDTVDVSGAPVAAGGETQTYMPWPNTEIDKLGNNTGLTKWRYVYYSPVTISGNTAVIRLHDNMLAYGTKYYATVDNGVLTGKMNGTAFAGVTSPTGWVFTTKAAPASQTDVTVANTGSADFRSVQGALDWIMTNNKANASANKTVTILNGDYNEQLFLSGVNNLTLAGQSRTGTVVYSDNSESYNPGVGQSAAAAGTSLTNEGSGTRRYLQGGRPVMLVEGSDMLKLTNFTLQNTHTRVSNYNNQAEAIYYNTATLTASRMVASYMRFLSQQDTIQTKGWVWYYNTYIAGNVDFIWGSPWAALFENSELHTVADPLNANGGTSIFQARAATGFPGFVVLNSTLTADAAVPANSTYLARSLTGDPVKYPPSTYGFCTQQYYVGGPFGNAQLYCDTAAYINTKMGAHISSWGWSAPDSSGGMIPNPSSPTATAGWREMGSMDASGAALSMTGRSKYGSSKLDLSGLNTTAQVFSGFKDSAGASWTPLP